MTIKKLVTELELEERRKLDRLHTLKINTEIQLSQNPNDQPLADDLLSLNALISELTLFYTFIYELKKSQ